LLAVAREREEPNAGLIEANLLSLSYGEVVAKDSSSNDGLLPESFETYQIVHPGDVVFRLTDLQNDKRSLRTAVVRERGIITSAYTAVVPMNIESSYLGYLLRAYDCDKVFYSMGGGLRQSMKYSDIKRLPVLVAPAVERRFIVDFLDEQSVTLSALIAEQTRLIAVLREERRAIISHAVTRGLNPDATMKDSGGEWLGRVPAHWEVRRVKSLATFVTSGPRGWSERVAEEGSLFVQSGDLDEDMRIEFSSVKRVRVPSDAEAARCRLCDGDVVICITGAKTGNVAICKSVPEEAYINQHLCLVRPGCEVSPEFLALVLKSGAGQTYFERSQYGLKQGLLLDAVGDTPVPLPPRAEQDAIVGAIFGVVERFRRLMVEAERAIALLQERRTALISAAVTGKIDVRGMATGAAV
jgi:type I restriction enzyme S subunit